MKAEKERMLYEVGQLYSEYMARPNPITGKLGPNSATPLEKTYEHRKELEKVFRKEKTDALSQTIEDGISQ